ncbi:MULTISPECIES: LysR family transcriptional regulator [unclassified Gilliamella]|uniref:LysR family transcriptional regulator n=1 Tax=unclassified Gilliamella TaxID=2685620 RepID=UPI00226A0FD3|nr:MULTISPECIES: LysR family transcriptional regulator [unclassified Gilliamella]MCX8641521.1 LysR family transcriptional regulator [Gilliamella sp. B3835]MCX8706736.1 LysR family transcriptional regulator [Gilliamella sp. B3783]MCX8708594.1 LysR family transcriptional regulator [Gilliamella sp. B3780]MCX8711118.1 LysR family transcriptional regulator [Gilliamella sp. B3468]MCX8713875.1 LysR family transcriptional regulator [Gilliamella sp. B3781]
MDLLKCMEAFVVTVKTGSFVATSVSLNTSPQMVTKYISYLEKYIGLKLLNRTTRSQHLTEFGKQYYERCLFILDEVKATKNLAQQFSEEPNGRLRISAPVSFGHFNLIPVISCFMKRYPKVNIDLQLSDRYVDLVQDDFDAVFRIGVLDDSSLIARKLKSFQLIFAAAPSYLAKYGIPSVPNDIKKHQCLIYQYVNPTRKDHLWSFKVNGQVINLPISGMLQSNDTFALAQAAIQGLGVTMLPESMLSEAIKQQKLLPILQEYLPPPREVHLLYTADKRQLLKLKMFIEFIVDKMA